MTTELNTEAMAEALYLVMFPVIHAGCPPGRCWPDLHEAQRAQWRRCAEQIAETYPGTLVPFAERTPLKLRDVAPELHERIHVPMADT